MRHGIPIVLAAMTTLVACGDPLEDVERLSGVTLAEDATAATLAPPPNADGGGAGFLGRLFGGSVAATPDVLPASVSAGVVAPGTTIPFGEVATVCGLDPAELGTAVEQAAGYVIYDSAPGTTAARTQYVTGFDDGCARQVTGALLLLGDPGTYEALYYAAGAGGDASQSTTAATYAAIRTGWCGVPPGQNCSSNLVDMAARTTFLTVYERFGGGGARAEMLLHGGAVAAMGVEG